MFETTITRRKETEALQAIKDLTERGFYIYKDLTEKKSTTLSRGDYNYRAQKYRSIGAGISSVWICVMRKDD